MGKKISIALCGFPGSGKTSVARELCESFGWSWVDLDLAIEEREKISISEIFRLKGESHFRRAESECLLELLGRAPDVISLGGGALLSGDNCRTLRTRSILVHLKIGLETAVDRLMEDELLVSGRGGVVRPLFLPADGLRSELEWREAFKAKVEGLMNKRAGLYDIARVSIKTDLLTPAECASVVVGERGKWAAEFEKDSQSQFSYPSGL